MGDQVGAHDRGLKASQELHVGCAAGTMLIGHTIKLHHPHSVDIDTPVLSEARKEKSTLSGVITGASVARSSSRLSYHQCEVSKGGDITLSQRSMAGVMLAGMNVDREVWPERVLTAPVPDTFPDVLEPALTSSLETCQPPYNQVVAVTCFLSSDMHMRIAKFMHMNDM